jgi:large subunit ribosomal protein L19
MDVSTLVEIKKNAKIPDIAPGDTVRVSTKIIEGDKERIQVFQGVVIKIKRGGNGAGYTVRHVAFGIGVERTFPMNSPLVEKVEIVRQGKVRRSRLYYLRELSGKEARRKIKRVERKARQVGEELLQEQPEEEIEPIMDEAAVKAAAKKEAAEKAAAEAAAKATETAREGKKETAAEKPKEKAPAAAKEEVAAEKTVEKAPVAEKKEAEKPAKTAKDEKKEEPEA